MFLCHLINSLASVSWIDTTCTLRVKLSIPVACLWRLNVLVESYLYLYIYLQFISGWCYADSMAVNQWLVNNKLERVLRAWAHLYLRYYLDICLRKSIKSLGQLPVESETSCICNIWTIYLAAMFIVLVITKQQVPLGSICRYKFS